MRTFDKSNKLDNVRYEIRGRVLQEASRLEMEGAHIIKLNIGNPAPFNFKAPHEITVDMIYNLRNTQGYSDSKGLYSARKAIMQYCQTKNIPNVQVDDIYTGNGVSELITLSMQALINNGDEILVPMPDYPLWTAAVTLAGGKAVHYLCDEENEWFPDLEDIKSKITENTKGIVVINPNNPTGAVYSDELLKGIVQIARENELIIFADEIYDRLVYQGEKHTAIASFAPDLLTLCFNGLSKSHYVAGYRAGWMCLAGDKSRAQGYIEGLNLLSTMRLCSNVPAQSVIQTALGGSQEAQKHFKDDGRLYLQREYVYERLNAMDGITAVKPKGAFYIFPKIDTEKFNITDDEQFALDLLKETGVLITCGSGFNWHKPDHFRIVYLPEIPRLKKAMDKLEAFLESYKQK
ncbi:MAG: pyridoxal phosphate-dependent aminotransferase [Ruminococcaceae bacterium]|nr:pyridoxal phosphate-dependent aminotransferase [Oscillospiraceae bacterium]